MLAKLTLQLLLSRAKRTQGATLADRAGSVCGVLWVGGTAPEQEAPVAAALVQAAKELSTELAEVSSVLR